jgi:hypothetical protein
MDFIKDVVDFFLKGGAKQHLIFGTASAIIGILVILLDFIHYLLKRKKLMAEDSVKRFRQQITLTRLFIGCLMG